MPWDDACPQPGPYWPLGHAHPLWATFSLQSLPPYPSKHTQVILEFAVFLRHRPLPGTPQTRTHTHTQGQSDCRPVIHSSYPSTMLQTEHRPRHESSEPKHARPPTHRGTSCTCRMSASSWLRTETCCMRMTARSPHAPGSHFLRTHRSTRTPCSSSMRPCGIARCLARTHTIDPFIRWIV